MDPGAGNHIAYEATVAEVEDLGLWLACWDQTVAGQTSYALERFTELERALAAFADRADDAAGQAERNETLSMPDVLASVLRYRAATTRTEITRARLGDALRARRGQVAGDHSLSRAGAGLDREGRLGPGAGRSGVHLAQRAGGAPARVPAAGHAGDQAGRVHRGRPDVHPDLLRGQRRRPLRRGRARR